MSNDLERRWKWSLGRNRLKFLEDPWFVSLLTFITPIMTLSLIEVINPLFRKIFSSRKVHESCFNLCLVMGHQVTL